MSPVTKKERNGIKNQHLTFAAIRDSVILFASARTWGKGEWISNKHVTITIQQLKNA